MAARPGPSHHKPDTITRRAGWLINASKKRDRERIMNSTPTVIPSPVDNQFIGFSGEMVLPSRTISNSVGCTGQKTLSAWPVESTVIVRDSSLKAPQLIETGPL